MIKYFCDSCDKDVTNSTHFTMDIYCSKGSSFDEHRLLCEGCFNDMMSVIGWKGNKDV